MKWYWSRSKTFNQAHTFVRVEMFGYGTVGRMCFSNSEFDQILMASFPWIELIEEPEKKPRKLKKGKVLSVLLSFLTLLLGCSPQESPYPVTVIARRDEVTVYRLEYEGRTYLLTSHGWLILHEPNYDKMARELYFPHGER